MTKITETAKWEDEVYQISRNDKVAGGRDGGVNIQARQLGNRTQYLYKLLLTLQLAAYAAADIFPAPEDGLEKTNNGEYFQVPNGINDDVTLKIYLNSNGIAINVAEIPGPMAFENLKALINSVAEINAFAIDKIDGVSEASIDHLGKAVFQLLDDGVSQFSALAIGEGVELAQSGSEMVITNRQTGLELMRFKTASLSLLGQEIFSGDYDVPEAEIDGQGKVFEQTLSDGTKEFAAIAIGGVDVVRTGKGISIKRRADDSEIMQVWADGTIVENGVYTFLTDKYPGYSEIELDGNGRVFRQRQNNGVVEEIGLSSANDNQRPAVAAVEGNIIAVAQDVVTQVTADDGINNIAPLANDTFIRFISDFDGTYKNHRISYDGLRRARESKGVLLHAIGAGQSLEAGGSTISQAPVTTEPQADYGILAFSCGPKIDFKYDTLDLSLLESLIPCRENAGSRPGQESPASGLAYQLHKTTGHTVLVSSAASSGTAIADISAGTASFTGATAMIEKAVAIAAELELEYQPILVIIHGNQDAAGGTAIASYIARMETLRAQYQAVINNATGGDYTLKMFVAQLANTIPYGGAAGSTQANRIGIAQYQAARDNENILLASTQYARAYSDGEHLTSVAYRQEGEVLGLTIGRWLNDATHSALMPDEAGIVQSGATITIPVKNCVGNLVVDTSRVADPGYYGFTLTGAAIASVEVIGGDDSATIIITKTDETAATSLSYAATGIAGQNPGPLTGSRGCVRDSRPGASLTGEPLYNDLVVFTYSF